MNAKPYNLCSGCGYLIDNETLFEVTDVKILDVPEVIETEGIVRLWENKRRIRTLGIQTRVANKRAPQNVVKAFMSGIRSYKDGSITYSDRGVVEVGPCCHDITPGVVNAIDDVSDVVSEYLGIDGVARTLATLPIMKGNTVVQQSLQELPGCMGYTPTVRIRNYSVGIAARYNNDDSQCIFYVSGERLMPFPAKFGFDFDVPIAELDLKPVKVGEVNG